MDTEIEDKSMAEPRQTIEGMSVLEDASIYVELEANRNVEAQ